MLRSSTLTFKSLLLWYIWGLLNTVYYMSRCLSFGGERDYNCLLSLRPSFHCPSSLESLGYLIQDHLCKHLYLPTRYLRFLVLKDSKPFRLQNDYDPFSSRTFSFIQRLSGTQWNEFDFSNKDHAVIWFLKVEFQ